MGFDIRTKNLTLGDGARRVVVGKLTRFVRRLPLPDESDLVVKLEADRHRTGGIEAQISVSSRGATLRASRRASDVLTAVTNALAALDTQVARHRARLYHTESARRRWPRSSSEQP